MPGAEPIQNTPWAPNSCYVNCRPASIARSTARPRSVKASAPSGVTHDSRAAGHGSKPAGAPGQRLVVLPAAYRSQGPAS
jgi:hypothetical protein